MKRIFQISSIIIVVLVLLLLYGWTVVTNEQDRLETALNNCLNASNFETEFTRIDSNFRVIKEPVFINKSPLKEPLTTFLDKAPSLLPPNIEQRKTCEKIRNRSHAIPVSQTSEVSINYTEEQNKIIKAINGLLDKSLTPSKLLSDQENSLPNRTSNSIIEWYLFQTDKENWGNELFKLYSQYDLTTYMGKRALKLCVKENKCNGLKPIDYILTLPIVTDSQDLYLSFSEHYKGKEFTARFRDTDEEYYKQFGSDKCIYRYYWAEDKKWGKTYKKFDITGSKIEHTTDARNIWGKANTYYYFDPKNDTGRTIASYTIEPFLWKLAMCHESKMLAVKNLSNEKIIETYNELNSQKATMKLPTPLMLSAEILLHTQNDKLPENIPLLKQKVKKWPDYFESYLKEIFASGLKSKNQLADKISARREARKRRSSQQTKFTWSCKHTCVIKGNKIPIYVKYPNVTLTELNEATASACFDAGGNDEFLSNGGECKIVR